MGGPSGVHNPSYAEPAVAYLLQPGRERAEIADVTGNIVHNGLRRLKPRPVVTGGCFPTARDKHNRPHAKSNEGSRCHQTKATMPSCDDKGIRRPLADQLRLRTQHDLSNVPCILQKFECLHDAAIDHRECGARQRADLTRTNTLGQPADRLSILLRLEHEVSNTSAGRGHSGHGIGITPSELDKYPA